MFLWSLGYPAFLDTIFESLFFPWQACGVCRGRLQLLGRFNSDGTPAKTRAPSQYSLFVKGNFAAARAECAPGTPHADVMRKLSVQWKSLPKPTQQPSGLAGGSAQDVQ